MKNLIKTRPIDEPMIEDSLNNDFHPVLRRIFATRGIKHSNEVDYSLAHLLPFNTLKGIQQAAEAIASSLKKQEHIMLVGDYDADGATSCALAISALKAFGAEHVSYIVPNRFEFGYGLTPELVQSAAKQEPDLLITVDNGIASHTGVETANQMGMKVIITDHHLPSPTLPNALAIVNPNQEGDEFPSKHLAGVGVIFYVMLALRQHLREQSWYSHPLPNLAQFLDLVALGTVADVVPLDKNNRILVHQGLLRMRAGQCRMGIKVLLELSQRNIRRVVASDLSFGVAPRLNAAGRLDDMSIGIQCLLSETLTGAVEKARQLDELNKERRKIEVSMQEHAETILNRFADGNPKTLPSALSVYDPAWHQGVIGIVAGRLKERYHRPVAAFARDKEEELKGSLRSVRQVHVRDVLANIDMKHPNLIKKFGGHAMAAGLTIKENDFKQFSLLFSAEVSKQLPQETICGEYVTDGKLSSNELTPQLAELLRDAAPWGQGFPEPTFYGEFDLLKQQLVGKKHLQCVLSLPESSLKHQAIAFNVDVEAWPNYVLERIRCVYRLSINDYQGNLSLQLMLDYLEPIA